MKNECTEVCHLNCNADPANVFKEPTCLKIYFSPSSACSSLFILQNVYSTTPNADSQSRSRGRRPLKKTVLAESVAKKAMGQSEEEKVGVRDAMLGGELLD